MAKRLKASSRAAFALALLASTSASHVDLGSLVVASISRNGDYVVAGAESRDIVAERTNGFDDSGCKIVGLGGDTLFFVTGTSLISLHSGGASWDAVKVARASYLESKRRDAEGLSVIWGDKAPLWFSPRSQRDLRLVADGPDRKIVTGGFITFDHNGALSFQRQTIYYPVTTNSLARQSDSQPPRLGHIVFDGMGGDSVREFVNEKTERAFMAWGADRRLFECCRNAATDSEVVRKAIQFAVDNSTGEDKRTLGGPIDIAILRKNQTIEWVSRKTKCYALDLKPTRTKAPSDQDKTLAKTD